MTIKDVSIFSSGGHLVYRSGKVLAILVGSHLGNIPMKFESHWPMGSGGVSFNGNYPRFSIFSSGGHFIHRSETVLAILVEGLLSNISMKFKIYWPRGIGGFDV